MKPGKPAPGTRRKMTKAEVELCYIYLKTSTVYIVGHHRGPFGFEPNQQLSREGGKTVRAMLEEYWAQP